MGDWQRGVNDSPDSLIIISSSITSCLWHHLWRLVAKCYDIIFIFQISELIIMKQEYCKRR